MDRRDIREKTMQLVFQMDASSCFERDALNYIDENAAVYAKRQSKDTLDAIESHVEEIDELIAANLDKWSFDRIAKTDLAILRTAVAEMLYIDYIPTAVSINEAVELSRKYGDDKSYKFVNSVLGKISKAIDG